MSARRRACRKSLADLQNYELLILSNVPATALTQRQMEVARTYVQDLGGGFIMLGGDQSFGLGGYYKTVLEEILPVRSDFEKEKEKPSLAMVLVIDKSGSMGGEKIEMAKDGRPQRRRAARATATRSASSPSTARTSGSARCSRPRNKGHIIDEISRIEAGGGTVMYPAMEEAYEMLQRDAGQAQARDHPDRRHLVARRLRGDRQTMAPARITVSTVAVGERRRHRPARRDRPDRQRPLLLHRRPGADPADLRQGDGDRQQVGHQRAAVHARRSSGRRRCSPRSTSTTRRSCWATSMTRPKPTCEVILATEKGDPLLAWWRYGLGMTRGVHFRRQEPAGPPSGSPGRASASSGRRSSATRCARARPRGSPSQVDSKDGQATVTLDADRRGRPVPQRRPKPR